MSAAIKASGFADLRLKLADATDEQLTATQAYWAALLNRPGATPAPTAAGPGDDPGLTRLAPNANRQRLTAITTGTDALIAGSRADVADVHTTIARHRRAAA